MAKRTDKERKVLRKGESQRKNGMYDYRWTSKDGKRHSVGLSSKVCKFFFTPLSAA